MNGTAPITDIAFEGHSLLTQIPQNQDPAFPVHPNRGNRRPHLRALHIDQHSDTLRLVDYCIAHPRQPLVLARDPCCCNHFCARCPASCTMPLMVPKLTCCPKSSCRHTWMPESSHVLPSTTLRPLVAADQPLLGLVGWAAKPLLRPALLSFSTYTSFGAKRAGFDSGD